METSLDFIGPYLNFKVTVLKDPPAPKLFTEEWKAHSPLYKELLEEAIEHYGPNAQDDLNLDIAIFVKLLCDAAKCHWVSK